MAGIPYSATQVIQVALNLLGFPLVTSIDAGGPAAAAMLNVYDGLLAADLSSPNWRFATKVAVLSQIAGIDPDYEGYTAAYQMPPDCLAIWKIYPTIPYNIFGERIWTMGNGELKMQYRHAGPMSLYPPAYIWYFCYLLARTVAPSVTEDPKIISYIDADMTKWRAQAMVVNAQNKRNSALTNSPWISGRMSGWQGNIR